jgi:NADH-quinone oxidoreductase subunit G
LIVPLYHIFGSEELSLLSPAIQEQAPTLYIALNANDAARLGVNDGEQVKLDLMGSTYSLPLKGRPEIPEGVAGLPVGMRELQFVDLPAWARLARI